MFALKKICLIMIFTLPCSVLSAQSLVELKNGDRITESFTLRDKIIKTASGKLITPDKVKQILFGSGNQAGAGYATGTSDSVNVFALASQAAIFEAKYPDAGGIMLLDENRNIYNSDGTFKFQFHFIGRIKKEDHKSWADQIVTFTEGRDRVVFKVARCILPDGTVFNADISQMKISKPQISPGIFVKYMIASLHIPGAQIGSIIEVEWELETYNPFNREFFFPINYFQSREPVFISRLVIETPESKPLYWETRNFPQNMREPQQKVENGVRRYSWELRENIPLIEELYMPKSADSLPYVQASLFEGWDKIHDWINQYWVKNTTPSPELASKAVDLVKGLDKEDEKVAKIFHWVEKNIRYIIIKGDAATLYGSYPAHETLQKQFGCCVDKAMVFTAMLNAVGVKSGPLMINAGSHEMSKRIPNLTITHSITRVTRTDGKKYYLDSTSSHFKYPSLPCVDQGRLCIDPFDRSVDYIPMQKPEENLHKIISSMTLKLDGTLAASSIKKYTGESEAVARAIMKSKKPLEREKLLCDRINDYGKGATLIKFDFQNLEDIEKPYSYTFDYQISSYPREISDLMIFKIPGYLETLRFQEVAVASRSYPIEYDGTMMNVEEGSISFPQGIKIRSVPDNMEIKNDFLQFEGKFERVGDNLLKYKASFSRTAKLVPLNTFIKYKSDLEKIERFSQKRIFLVKEQQGGKE